MILREVADRLLFLKPLLNFIFLLGFGAIIYLFLFSSITLQNQYALPSLLLALWSLLFSALLGVSANVPNEKIIGNSKLKKIRYKLAKGLFTISIIVFIFMTLAVLRITIKLLSVWF
ncbi:hypothetical protein [Cognaticolwellia mytili]|uniref:hypothetical protein n=1 Tax=Cognaticolwellia mytili TaxID=1888913 RepID=UPI000A176DA4|nr:hypothetical protein [Cognaticolwellia mytili]